MKLTQAHHNSPKPTFAQSGTFQNSPKQNLTEIETHLKNVQQVITRFYSMFVRSMHDNQKQELGVYCSLLIQLLFVMLLTKREL
jgi:hypothetical protein